MMNNEFRNEALGLNSNGRLMGCEGDDLGTPDRPSTWLFGIEHGDSDREYAITNDGGEYSIEKQLQFEYNRNAFRLLARINGSDADTYEAFAHEKQPFVRGRKGFYKGNLYPVACRNVSVWSDEAVAFTGFNSKTDMRDWCRVERFAHLQSLFQKHQPQLFMGVGITQVHDYCLMAGVDIKSLNQKHFTGQNGLNRRYYYGQVGATVFAVIPHLSRSGPYCLTDVPDIERVGQHIAELLAA
tara:strand:- start:11495 stop:12217 length:723 start_codon:yes stop_codon:yes gene_type:complete